MSVYASMMKAGGFYPKIKFLDLEGWSFGGFFLEFIKKTAFVAVMLGLWWISVKASYHFGWDRLGACLKYGGIPFLFIGIVGLAIEGDQTTEGVLGAFVLDAYFLLVLRAYGSFGQRLGLIALLPFLVFLVMNIQFVQEKTKAIRARKRIRAGDRLVVEKSKEAVTKLADDMVWIPGEDFAMCKYPVTEALWYAVMGELPLKVNYPSFADSFEHGPDIPRNDISIKKCRQFLTKLNGMPEVKKSGYIYRIPATWEWIKSSQGAGDGIKKDWDKISFCYLADGTEITEETLGEVAWFRGNSSPDDAGLWSIKRLWISGFWTPCQQLVRHPVGQKLPNGFGLHDVFGNVAELTSHTDEDGQQWVCLGGSIYSESEDCSLGHNIPLLREDYGDDRTGLRLCAIRRSEDIADFDIADLFG